ncbi:phosphatidylglycerophosphatase A [Vagococcus penaei]|uniref:Phosphatidylglycerophosphatase A n=1 Tax=Vagococcus penaei TaxID=633807 RepID=A0A1Q2D7K7_9ENTE|nr:phosphatidylglycerophosphatase A [Vagococcus penaei]AQP54384.1 phosphatidylglycerophosphatase A [Vagococcus penaei]RSU06299.1 phosphatidylglycerophosphatase A [Vagococcus penaei]
MILNKENMKQSAKDVLLSRGVTMKDMAELVYFLQESYVPDLTLARCEENIEAVLAKREVQNAIFTGVQLDKLAEQKKLDEPLQDMLEADASLYGIDEILALAIVNVYGSIGFTNYGYIDKVKPGVLAKLNDHSTHMVHTFLDDIVGAIAAAAASRLAHSIPE